MAAGHGLTSCLRHRDFRFFIGAFLLEGVGGWAYSVALTVWIYDRTGSVAFVTVATVARYVPAIALGTYAGVVADRLEKIGLMWRIDVACAVVMGVLAALMAAGASVGAVIAVAAVSSTLGIFYSPAASGMTPLLVPERDLASANALRNTRSRTSRSSPVPPSGPRCSLSGRPRWPSSSTPPPSCSPPGSSATCGAVAPAST